MGATSDNYNIVTSGTTYTIASDYVKVGSGETAHHQIVKIAHGANDTVNYVSNLAPLPVGLCGSWTRYEYLATSGYYGLATTIVGITGTSLTVVGVSGGQAVGITVGTLNVAGSAFDIRKLFGGAVGATSGSTSGIDYVAVQGISNAYPVGITVSSALPVTVSSFSNLGVFGVTGATAVYVQASNFNIRGLTATSDTITVFGGGTASTVSVGLFGFTGATAAPIYAENNALNVNVKSSGTIAVSSTNLDIRDLDYTADTVTIVGQGKVDSAGKSTVPTYQNITVAGGDFATVGGITGSGWCGAAMNVYLVNSGGFSFNASATFSAIIGITAPSYGAIPVQGTTTSSYGVWVAGDTANGPVIVKGFSGGLLPVEISNIDISSSTVNSSIQEVKTNTDFMAAVKKALYSDAQSVGAFDFSDKNSIYTLIRDNVGSNIQTVSDSVIVSGSQYTTQNSLAVTVVDQKQQTKFMARTGSATNTPQSLTAYSAASGYTCANGVRIKTSRIATGANSSQNEIMCVISEADAAIYGASAGSASYVLYHGDEMFFEVDNINKIKVFYPAYSASFAPHNTGVGMTFSFYAS